MSKMDLLSVMSFLALFCIVSIDGACEESYGRCYQNVNGSFCALYENGKPVGNVNKIAPDYRLCLGMPSQVRGRCNPFPFDTHTSTNNCYQYCACEAGPTGIKYFILYPNEQYAKHAYGHNHKNSDGTPKNGAYTKVPTHICVNNGVVLAWKRLDLAIKC